MQKRYGIYSISPRDLSFPGWVARAQVRKSDMSTFFEDMAAVRPTTMLLIPRLANMMYDKLVGQLEQVPGGSEDAQAAHRQASSLICCLCLQSNEAICCMGLGSCIK